MKYRPDIDGLRAISVIAVILFHSGLSIFKGGFIGVDIFFVISGYLITSLILYDLKNNEFNLINFYKRRAKRILPVLFFIIIVCLPLSWFLFSPIQMENFSESILSIIFFSSNFLFWKKTNYFNNLTENEILLHTWSLSVEEQFYLFFPIFIIILWKLSKNRIFKIILFISICSLLISEIGWRFTPVANFYLAPTRAWEILSGSLVALALENRRYKANNFLSLSGFILIIFSFIFFDEKWPFPSIYTLLPVIGVSLIIIYSNKSTILYKILSLRSLVFIGLISYSAYLWHLPVLSFFIIITNNNLNNLNLILIICGIFILANFSYKFIEVPFRKNFFSEKKTFAILFASFILLIIFSTLGKYTSGFENRFLNSDQDIKNILNNQKNNSNFINEKYSESYIKRWKNNSKPKVLLIGDSFSQDIYNSLYEADILSEIDILLRYEPYDCGLLFLDKKKVEKILPKTSSHICSNKINLIEDISLIRNLQITDHLWLASNWKEDQIKYNIESLDELKKLTSAKILIFGKKQLSPLNITHLDLDADKRANIKILDKLLASNIYFKKQIDSLNLKYFDIQEIICQKTKNNHQFCKPYDSLGMPKSFDGGHLSIYGAKYLGSKIKNDLICIIKEKCEF